MLLKTISVIITTFNAEHCIARTLHSIKNQEGIDTSFCIELIIIDDCSTDNTIDIIKPFNVKLIQNKTNSGGPNKGRNIGLGLATGDYTCIVDQDDEWKSNRILSVLPYLDDASIVSSGYTLIDLATNKTIQRITNSDNDYIFYKQNETFCNKLMRLKNVQNTYLGSLIYNRNLNHVLFEEHFGKVDFDWILRLFYEQTSIEVNQSLYIRYVDGNNLSLNSTYRRQDFYYSLYFIEQYEERFPQQVKKGRKNIYGSRARYYYLIGNMKKARYYFFQSGISLKNIMYYASSFIGSNFVKKKFNVFG